MFLLDARGVLVYYNDAAALLIGKAYGDVGEMPAEEFGVVLNLKTPDGEPLRRRIRRLGSPSLNVVPLTGPSPRPVSMAYNGWCTRRVSAVRNGS